jgi:integrase
MPRKSTTKHRGVFLRNGEWWVRYWAQGREKREKVGGKQAAIDLYRQRKTEVRAGKQMPANLRHRGEKVSDIIDRALTWYESHRKKSCHTAKNHLLVAKAALGHMAALDLKPKHVDDWLTSRTDWTDATRNRYKATLGRALQLAVVDGHLNRNAARLVSIRREPEGRIRWLLPDEEERLTAAIVQDWPSYLESFQIALHTGMRQSEQYGLMWDRIDFNRKRIVLKDTKSGRGREIPLNKTALAAFEALRDRRPEGMPWVFLSMRYRKKPQRLMNPTQWFPQACETAKVHNFTWHSLRHTFISRLVMKGIPLPTVQQLAGHQSITMTARYSHLAPAHLAGAVEALD